MGTTTTIRSYGEVATRRGLSLMELMVALPIFVMLMTGMASAVYLAAKAVPGKDRLADTVSDMNQSVEFLADDLSFATSVTTLGTNQISFQVADRDGQKPPSEEIRYSWSGTRGDPLMREFNGMKSVVVDNVESFSLSYDKRAEALPVTSQESLETILAYSDGTYSTIGVDLGTTTWIAQSFLPLLDDKAIGWRLTRVRFLARQNGIANGTTQVQIQRADQGLPNQQVLSEATMSESSLGTSYSWQSFSFANLPACGPSESLCLVLAHGTNAPAATVQVWGSTAGNLKLASSSTSGQRWNSANALLRFYVYGTVLTPAATTYQYRLTNIRCSLSLRGETVLRRDLNFRVLNEPVVSGP